MKCSLEKIKLEPVAVWALHNFLEVMEMAFGEGNWLQRLQVSERQDGSLKIEVSEGDARCGFVVPKGNWRYKMERDDWDGQVPYVLFMTIQSRQRGTEEIGLWPAGVEVGRDIHEVVSKSKHRFAGRPMIPVEWKNVPPSTRLLAVLSDQRGWEAD